MYLEAVRSMLPTFQEDGVPQAALGVWFARLHPRGSASPSFQKWTVSSRHEGSSPAEITDQSRHRIARDQFYALFGTRDPGESP